MAKRQGGGNYLFESVDKWCKIDIPGVVSDVATDSEGNVYLAVRTAQAFDANTGAILVFDRDGNHLNTFGEDKLRTPPRSLDHPRRYPLPRRHLRPLHPHLLPRRRPRHDTGSPR